MGEQDYTATEAARDLAAREGVDLDQVQGTGTDDRILKSDVVTYLEHQDAPELWTVSRWKDQDNYECTHCPFSTLDLSLMQEHALEHLPQPKKIRQVETEFFDRFDNPITKDVEED